MVCGHLDICLVAHGFGALSLVTELVPSNPIFLEKHVSIGEGFPFFQTLFVVPT